MTEPTPHEKYLRSLEESFSPEEFSKLLRKLGDAEAVLARHAAVTEILERDGRKRWAFRFFKEAATWLTAVGAALSLLFGAYLTAASVIRSLDRPAPTQEDSQP